LRLFGNHCISFYRRTQLGERLTHFHSRSLAYDYCGLGALANGLLQPPPTAAHAFRAAVGGRLQASVMRHFSRKSLQIDALVSDIVVGLLKIGVARLPSAFA